MTKQERLELANHVIEIVSREGFFRAKNRVARLELDDRGRIWYVNPRSERRVYTHNPGEWWNAGIGGTHQNLIRELRDFIRDGRCNLSINCLGFTPDDLHCPVSDLLPAWEAARPMFSPEAIAQLDAYLETLKEHEKPYC